jgi:plastocyanin
MRTISLFLTLLMAASSPAVARPVTLRIVDSGGRPVPNAIVSLRGPGAPTWRAGNERFSVSQKNLQFSPFVLLVPLGARVAFPNQDPTRHHVYSFSPAKHFELKLFARDQSRSIVFDKPGVVALGCNIHDSMSAFVVVTDNGWTARTDARGFASFPNGPTAKGTLVVWHPYLRSPGNQFGRPLSGAPQETVVVRLRPAGVQNDSGY